MTNELSDSAKQVGDSLSFVTLLGVLVQFLPSIASGLTVLWMLIRIYETETVQRILKRRQPGGN